jgi:hypothetical protein
MKWPATPGRQIYGSVGRNTVYKKWNVFSPSPADHVYLDRKCIQLLLNTSQRVGFCGWIGWRISVLTGKTSWFRISSFLAVILRAYDSGRYKV